uniref:Uncharacterized protein n=1 Tax=Toxoplasma gondii (strain ATCC 50861 / VEG) TaxID=432359 RepID=A0A0F7VCL7_TOXGV|nr:TPA: hypothetical protein BN1205_100450 [Toxoplasma gondii VEG]
MLRTASLSSEEVEAREHIALNGSSKNLHDPGGGTPAVYFFATMPYVSDESKRPLLVAVAERKLFGGSAVRAPVKPFQTPQQLSQDQARYEVRGGNGKPRPPQMTPVDSFVGIVQAKRF